MINEDNNANNFENMLDDAIDVYFDSDDSLKILNKLNGSYHTMDDDWIKESFMEFTQDAVNDLRRKKIVDEESKELENEQIPEQKSHIYENNNLLKPNSKGEIFF